MPATWRLFVYGTLKRGLMYHDAFCRDLIAATPARSFGCLYDTPYGYPMMTLPPRFQWVQGSADRNRDLALTAHFGQPGLKPPGPENEVFGELFVLPRCAATLAALDDLEDFDPPKASLYQRVMAPVWPEGEARPTPAWMYIVAPSLIQPEWSRMRTWPDQPW